MFEIEIEKVSVMSLQYELKIFITFKINSLQANTRVRGPAVLFCPYYATDTPYNPAGGPKGTHEVHGPHLLVSGGGGAKSNQ